MQADGTLLLNIGEDRVGVPQLEEDEINEAYTITAIAPGVLRVDAFGISQTYGDGRAGVRSRTSSATAGRATTASG